jgi:hypothetical protein
VGHSTVLVVRQLRANGGHLLRNREILGTF